MATFVTLAQAKTHLRVPASDTTNDVDVQMKLDHAEAIVLTYVGTTPTWRDIAAAWTPSTVPLDVVAAILKQCAELDRYRGDDAPSDRPTRDPNWGDLAPDVVGILRRFRDSVLA